jgi:predicted small integral membrane protein
MIGAVAAFAIIVTYDNIVDYDSNYEFVRHVMSMDTTFPGNELMHRAIVEKSILSVAYGLIIATEGLTGLLLTIGAFVLLARLTATAELFTSIRLRR